ncbi:glycosyltransferase [Microbacterium oleivorans]|uniref:glycosyltransferase n=1 Tax=Microbacterium oleivorans TaxID=273677 RepID=UPI0033C35A13
MKINSAARPRVIWVTNSPAPYRIPVWEALGEILDLEVHLFEKPDLAGSGRRGAEWNATNISPTGFSLRQLRSRRFGKGERVYYLLRERPARVLKGCRAVVLGAWESPACWQLNFAGWFRGVRRIGFYESTLHSQHHSRGPIRWARDAFFRSLHAVVVPGTAAERAVLDMGVPPDRIYRGFNAVDVQAFAEATEPASAAADTGHRYLYVGQLIRRKNVHALIRAFAAIYADGDRLTIVGDGPERASLECLANALGVRAAVDFTGPATYADLPGIMKGNDTLVLPSVEEVWGLVVNEALASGAHVVVSETAGVAESVRGMPGVYLSPPETFATAQAMAASRSDWRGRVRQPPILRHTPEAFADVFARAII